MPTRRICTVRLCIPCCEWCFLCTKSLPVRGGVLCFCCDCLYIWTVFGFWTLSLRSSCLVLGPYSGSYSTVLPILVNLQYPPCRYRVRTYGSVHICGAHPWNPGCQIRRPSLASISSWSLSRLHACIEIIQRSIRPPSGVTFCKKQIRSLVDVLLEVDIQMLF